MDNPFPALAVGALLLMGCAALLIEVPDITGEPLSGRLAMDIATLASDEFQGRRPGTAGGKKAVEYIERRFREIGLAPGNGDSYRQLVTMTRVRPGPPQGLIVSSGGDSLELSGNDDFIGWASGAVPVVSFTAHEIVLVGFGAQAPEYDWDDYADLDVAGKIVLMFRNDPGYASGKSTVFNGKRGTSHGYYRRKFQVARQQGAAAAFVIWDEELAASSYTWAQTRGYWGRGRTRLSTDQPPERPEFVMGLIYMDAGRRMLRQSGLDYDSLLVAAATPGFKALPLGLTLTGDLRTEVEELATYNVMGLVRGSERPDELVIYMGHWDHMGMDTTLDGDQIYNGAVDNATGTAVVISLAEQFAALDQPPQRSIMFLAFTAEEMGLLGSRWYTENPVFPLIKTVAVINIDMIMPYGRTRDIIVFGLGRSDLDKHLRRAAAKRGMVLESDPWPQERIYSRSDHINLARKGVPALFAAVGVDHLANGREWGLDQAHGFMDSIYHTVRDEFDQSWDFSGIEDYVQLVFDVGYTIANQSKFPNWKRGIKFRAVRDKSLKAARASATASAD